MISMLQLQRQHLLTIKDLNTRRDSLGFNKRRETVALGHYLTYFVVVSCVEADEACLIFLGLVIYSGSSTLRLAQPRGPTTRESVLPLR